MLLTTAESIGGEWPDRCIEAAKMLTEVEESLSLGEQLLHDIIAVFEADGDPDFISSADLIGSVGDSFGSQPSGLLGLEEGPWTRISKGKAITTHLLAHLLKDYGVEPTRKSYAAGKGPLGTGKGPRGYYLAAVQAAWERWGKSSTDSTDNLDKSPQETKTPSTDQTDQPERERSRRVYGSRGRVTVPTSLGPTASCPTCPWCPWNPMRCLLNKPTTTTGRSGHEPPPRGRGEVMNKRTTDDRLPVVCMVVNCGELADSLFLLDMDSPAIFCCHVHYVDLAGVTP